MEQPEISNVMAGMEEVYRREDVRFKPPMCHFKPMDFESGEDLNGSYEWYMCSVCGCAKDHDGNKIEK